MRATDMATFMMTENTGRRPAYFQNQTRRFGLTMIVMGISFVLYYLGLFGGPEGPLTPSRMGEMLHGWGVHRHHVVVALIGLSMLSLAWNWLFNLGAWISGRRITCKASLKDGTTCGEIAIRRKNISKRTGRAVVEYICHNGHCRPEAYFHPVRKGVVANTIWIGCLILTLITLASV